MSLALILLPALFGLIGTVTGAFLTIYGQRASERRAQEVRREEHYVATATQLIGWLGKRADAVSLALAYSGGESRKHAQDAYERFPVSQFALRAQAAFPFLSQDIESYTQFEMELMKISGEIAQETEPFSRYDEKQRRAMVERLVILQRPLLAGFADVVSQLSIVYPKRLNVARTVEKAHLQREWRAPRDL